VIAVVPWSAALERMVKPCIASHESESRSDDARGAGEWVRDRTSLPVRDSRGVPPRDASPRVAKRSRARRVWLDFGG
jgi:hypothetical protein